MGIENVVKLKYKGLNFLFPQKSLGFEYVVICNVNVN